MMNPNRHSRSSGMAMMFAAYRVALAPKDQRENILKHEVDRIVRGSICYLCDMNIPMTENKTHTVLGLEVMCYAEVVNQQRPEFEPAKNKSRKQEPRQVKGRGVKSK